MTHNETAATGEEIAKTLDLMVATGEASDYQRARALLTMMFIGPPTSESLRRYRAEMHRGGAY